MLVVAGILFVAGSFYITAIEFGTQTVLRRPAASVGQFQYYTQPVTVSVNEVGETVITETPIEIQ